MHCHIVWHSSEGLALQFVERLGDIAGKVGVTQQWTNLCNSWNSYQTSSKPQQIDSGV
jgi:hypothetical protein